MPFGNGLVGSANYPYGRTPEARRQIPDTSLRPLASVFRVSLVFQRSRRAIAGGEGGLSPQSPSLLRPGYAGHAVFLFAISASSCSTWKTQLGTGATEANHEVTEG